jgi:hypothetical protein
MNIQNLIDFESTGLYKLRKDLSSLQLTFLYGFIGMNIPDLGGVVRDKAAWEILKYNQIQRELTQVRGTGANQAERRDVTTPAIAHPRP